MKNSWVVGLIVGLLVLAPVVAHAAEGQAMSGAKVTLSLTKNSTPSPWTSEMGYGNRVGHKLEFGVKNLLLGWLDLFKEPHEAYAAKGNVLKGIGYGLKDTLENELGGVVHVLTFPITSVDAPLPEGGLQL